MEPINSYLYTVEANLYDMENKTEVLAAQVKVRIGIRRHILMCVGTEGAPDFHREADKNNRTVMVLRWIQRCVWRFLIVGIKTLISWDFNTCVLLI